MGQLDGPRLDAKSGNTTSLVVLVHGYGADGNDLIALAQAWQPIMPNTAFVAPHAPDPLGHPGMGGRQWFELTFRNPGELWDGVEAAGPGLNEFIDDELARHNLRADRLGLVGFSQGTMLALHIGLRRSPPPAIIVGYSGVIAGPEHLSQAVRNAPATPPVALLHGANDDVIPIDALHLTREALAGAGVSVEWHVREGLGHGIDETGLRLGAEYLIQHLGN